MRDRSPDRTRRQFLAGSAAAAAYGLTLSPFSALAEDATPAVRSAARRVSPTDKLNVAVFGAGARRRTSKASRPRTSSPLLRPAPCRRVVPQVPRRQAVPRLAQAAGSREDDRRGAGGHARPQPRGHLGGAMQLGKHVYCEKPLARSIWEARRMAQVAAETGVATQMGTQGHAFEGTRRAVEVIRIGRHRRRARAARLDRPPRRLVAAGRPPADRDAAGPRRARLGRLARPGARAPLSTRPTRRSSGAGCGTSGPAPSATWASTTSTPPSGRWSSGAPTLRRGPRLRPRHEPPGDCGDRAALEHHRPPASPPAARSRRSR